MTLKNNAEYQEREVRTRSRSLGQTLKNVAAGLGMTYLFGTTIVPIYGMAFERMSLNNEYRQKYAWTLDRETCPSTGDVNRLAWQRFGTTINSIEHVPLPQAVRTCDDFVQYSAFTIEETEPWRKLLLYGSGTLIVVGGLTGAGMIANTRYRRRKLAELGVDPDEPETPLRT